MTDDFRSFVHLLSARLDAGAREYGDRSFARAPAALIDELAQEALDLAGWGYVLWCRLQRMRAAVDHLEAER